MTLSAGSPVGPYTVLVPLGTGGMGEVYKARDTRLGREVALKILPASRSLDRAFINRFRQEARTASSLNHPNIITIYDVGEEHELHFIAMELVEGQTLSEILEEGAMSVSQTIRVGSQIADGLAKAHAAGIVHRDLKPANVMVTPDGYAKILDFGLAKVLAGGEETVVGGDAAKTRAGVVMGTLGYMSPEQSAGDPVDYRSDQFCFGTMLYEMITGQRAFERPTSQATLLAILREEPVPVERLNPLAPPLLRAVIERCLAKRPEDRYTVTADLADALRVLREEITDATASRLQKALAQRRRSFAGVAAAAAGAALLAVLAVVLWPDGRAAPPALAYGAIRPLEESESELTAPSLSPDGKMVVFGKSENGRSDLFVRRVAGAAAVRLTDDEAIEAGPRFSPDGETIAFFRQVSADGATEIRLVPALGGAQKTVLTGAGEPAWSADGRRLAYIEREEDGFALATAALDGGDQRRLLGSDATFQFLSSPAWSPDGRMIAVVRGRGGEAREVWLVPLDGAAPRPLLDVGERVFADSPVFTHDGRGVLCSSNRLGATNLWYIPLDGGAPLQVTKGAGPDLAPSLARDGTLVYLTSKVRYALRVYDLEKRTEREVMRYSSFVWGPAFSPDGGTIAFSQGEADGSSNVWVVPTAGGAPRQLTTGPSTIYPRFTPDGASVLYHTWTNTARDRCWRISLSGGAPQALSPEHAAQEGYADMAPDGRSLAFIRAEDGAEFVYVMALPDGTPRRLTAGRSTLPKWSPDGAWIAFARDRSYDGGIFVIRPDGTGERRVSARGGWPGWWPDSDRIGAVVVGADGNQGLEVVRLAGGPPESLGVPFLMTNHPFDVSRDGRLLVSSNAVHFLSNIWLLQPR